MSEIIARFADGRFLVQESRTVESRYCGSGVPVRIGHVRQIEKVLSITTNYEKNGLITALGEARVGRQEAAWSGQPQAKADHLMVVMRRGDIPANVTAGAGSGYLMSGWHSERLMSGITSGLVWLGELLSGLIDISGKVTVTANIIGY